MSAVPHDPGAAAARPGLPGEQPLDPAQIPEAYWRAFSVAAFAMNRFIVDHMIRAARLFDDDLEAMVIFGVLAHLNVAHLMPPGTRPSQALNAQGRMPGVQARLRPVRLRDLCQITGRPRETIRRKLERLEAQGRVLRSAEGYVCNAQSVDEAMRALSADGVRRYMVAAQQIGAALRDAERALKADAQGAAGRAT